MEYKYYDHYAIIFDEDGKAILHISKDDLEINELLDDIANSLAFQFLNPESPKYIV